jgi:hypothetical protein
MRLILLKDLIHDQYRHTPDHADLPSDVLSHFEWIRADKRFRQMLKTVEAKADSDGRYIPEFVWIAWKDWDFTQKKIPSRGLTFFVQRILKRVDP